MFVIIQASLHLSLRPLTRLATKMPKVATLQSQTPCIANNRTNIRQVIAVQWTALAVAMETGHSRAILGFRAV